MDKYQKYINKAVQVHYENNDSDDERTGFVWTVTPSKLIILAFDDDLEIPIPLESIKSIKEIK